MKNALISLQGFFISLYIFYLTITYRFVETLKQNIYLNS